MSETRGIHCLQHNVFTGFHTMLCNLLLKKIIYFSLVNTFILRKISKNATL